MATKASELHVLVAGDVTIDWNLAHASVKPWRSVYEWRGSDWVSMHWQPGGAAMLAELLAEVGARLNKEQSTSITVHPPARPGDLTKITPADRRFHHSFAIWSEKKYAEKPPLDKEKAWRVDEFLGLQRASQTTVSLESKNLDTANLVILDDSNLGFRETPSAWPSAVNDISTDVSWIVLKAAKPIAQGSLWDKLHSQHADRLVVITTANDLRLSEVQISRELSWERTAQDLFWELLHNPCVNGLAHCAHVVVSFGAAGAVLLSRQTGEASRCTLVFDPRVIEGAWEAGFPGGMIGYTTCLAAGVLRQLMLDPTQPRLVPGIQSGLAALRGLHSDGYGEKGKSLDQASLVFPIKRVAECLGHEAPQFAVVEVQDPLRFLKHPNQHTGKPVTPGFWTILQDRYPVSLDRLAEDILCHGTEHALEGVPLGQFGNLLTVDRQEIESLRSIRSLVSEYCNQAKQKRPLNIAVFGAPGSGKSFGIIEVANSLLPGQIEVREFNLSQLASPTDLIAALHQVRDIGLAGKIPLIFWDEFDSTLDGSQLGWLRYFLSPMQDGRFYEGQLSHPIGRAIFVFAGGTASSMAEFGCGLSDGAFRTAKGPDFASRLKGYVNILGPNPVLSCGETPDKDPYWIIRRAILLRSILMRSAPELFEKGLLKIDTGVMRALLKTRVYRHGVRSIESIIAMSQLAGKKTFERSSLPSEGQLDLHVDGQDFLALVQQIELDGPVLELLAAESHEIYRQGLLERRDFTAAGELEYAELPEEQKEKNRQNVRDIPAKLAQAGFAMLPARSNEPEFEFPGDALMLLAEVEHERWMQEMLAQGWRFAPKSNSKEKLSHLLCPWAELEEKEKAKDIDLVKGIPRMLARAGYAIVKSRKS